MREGEKPDFLKYGEDDSSVTVGNDKLNLAQFRKWFQAAVESGQRWRTEAKEDYQFFCGKQWTDEEIRTFEKQKRPVIVINHIKPLLNILSGYQRINRLDIDFLGRTADDVELAQVRRGVTKYVLDRCDYDSTESAVFMDCAIGGLGWFGVKYKFKYEINDGEAVVERIDPFSMYVDPEAHELDYSDAKYIFRAKWCDKEELKNVYPDKAGVIENAFFVYDKIEEDGEDKHDIDPSWYNSELKKVRVIECWYKSQVKTTAFYTQDGQVIQYDETDENSRMQIEQLIATGAVVESQEIPVTKVKVCTFFDTTLLEDIPSPYQHGEFPYIPMLYHFYGVGDIPAGFVRDLKAPQKELNKRRIQELHILDNSAGGGGFYATTAINPLQKAEFEENINIPGHWQEVISLDGIRERQPVNPPTAIINAEQQANSDLTQISGINEQLLSTDMPKSASGRAIELRQKQAQTHLAVIFDSLRRAKKKIANLLWGSRGKAGIISQFYTAEKIYRTEGENGQEFIPVNEQVLIQDPIAGAIVKTLNDLSVGDFDIVVSDVESSTTARQAQLWNLVDAVSKLNIPADIIFDTIIKLSDLPQKNEIIQKWQQRLQQQQMQAQQQSQAQIELERVKNENLNQTIAFKDASPPIQLLMAIKAGLIPQEYVPQLLPLAMQQIAPQVGVPMQQAQPQVPPPLPQQQGQMLPPEMLYNQPQPSQGNSPALTEAALQGYREQLTPVV